MDLERERYKEILRLQDLKNDKVALEEIIRRLRLRLDFMQEKQMWIDDQIKRSEPIISELSQKILLDEKKKKMEIKNG